jgi:hypothetical protein
MDPWLVAVLIVAALLCLYGIGWGRVECWNPDQMALRDLCGLQPNGFTKPPFHTYLNHLFVLSPVHIAEAIASLISGTKQQFMEVRLLGSRLVVVTLFLGTIILGYTISFRFYGKFAARLRSGGSAYRHLRRH